MDFFTGYNNLSPSVRSLVLTLICIMPFWYLDLSLFSEWFSKKYPVHIQLITVFCLSICWILAVAFMRIWQDDYTKKQENETEEEWTNRFLLDIVMSSISTLGVITFIFYLTGWSFRSFVICSFGFAGTLAVIKAFRYTNALFYKVFVKVFDEIERKRKERVSEQNNEKKSVLVDNSEVE